MRVQGLALALLGVFSCRVSGPSASPDVAPLADGPVDPADPSFEELASEVWDLAGQLRDARALEVAEARTRTATAPEDKARFQLMVGSMKVAQGDIDEGAALIATAQRDMERLGITGLPLAEAMGARGSLAFAKGDYDAALEAWARAAEMIPGETPFERRFIGRMGYNRGMAYYRQGHFEAARLETVRALEHESGAGVPECPDLALTWRQLGDIHMALRNHDDAARYLETSIDLCAGMEGGELLSAGLELSLAHALSVAGRHEDALALVRRARASVEDDPDGQEARFSGALNEVLMLDRAGREDDALALVDAVTPRFRKDFGEPHPFMVSLCMTRVSLLGQTDRYSEAREAIATCRAEALRLPQPGSLLELVDGLEASLPPS